MKRAGIVDVAQLAGVSRQTVTRAIHDMPGINPETRRRVLEAAAELKYRPSRFGRGLVKQGTPTLGLIVIDLTNPYYSLLASSVLEAASTHGWTVLVAEKAHGGDAALRELATQVDAVIGYFGIDDEVIEEIFRDLPVVTLDRAPRPDGRAAVDIDFTPGIAAALDHLVAAGRHRIVMLDCSTTDDLSTRASDYERLSAERSLPSHVLRVSGQTEPDLAVGERAVDELRTTVPDADAIIAFNDTVAIGAIKKLRRNGVRVPEDMAVVGIDGLPIATIVTPELTTLNLDMSELGRTAVDLVVGMSDGRLPLTGSEVQSSVRHSLVIRESA